MIQLRPLCPQDAPLMLEWMHDAEAMAHMHAHFGAMTLQDCLAFIAAAGTDRPNLHRAATDEQGVYLGTVSLKNIDPDRREAEFAIAMRRCARGNGQSAQAMQAILALGFRTLGLRRIYWCVDHANERARHFYGKQGYTPLCDCPDEQGLLWYEIIA